MQVDIPVPKHCHLFSPDITQEETSRPNFETIKDYPEQKQLDADDCKRALLKCSRCGQLYFYEFLEWIDWDGGNDPQYRTFIPVKSEDDSDYINGLTSIEIFAFQPRLQVSWPNDEPQTIEWVLPRK